MWIFWILSNLHPYVIMVIVWIGVWIAVCWVKIYIKMGLSIGSAFIPFQGPVFTPVYGGYTIFKNVWDGIYFFVPLAFWGMDVMLSISRVPTSEIVSWICQLAILVFIVIIDIKLAKAFGRGIGFAMGLLFLYPIFLGILAFGEDKYIYKASPENDVIEHDTFDGIPAKQHETDIFGRPHETDEPWR